MKIIITTERLYIREKTADDAENAYLLNLDPEVIKYTGDPPFESIEAAKIFLQNYNHYTKYGFGRWAVIDKANNEYLGWCGLKYSADLNEYDIGFRFFKLHWNKGYATEAAQACLKLGFEDFKMEKIVGRAMKQNLGSIRVLQKLGMTYTGTFDFDKHEGELYSLTKENFLALNSPA